MSCRLHDRARCHRRHGERSGCGWYPDGGGDRRSQQRWCRRGVPHDCFRDRNGVGASALSVEQLERDKGLGRDLLRRGWSSGHAAGAGFCERARRLERGAAFFRGECQARLGLLDCGHGPGGCGHDRVSGSAGWRSERDESGVVSDRSAEHVVDPGELAGWAALGLRCRRRERSGAGSAAAERAAWPRDHGRRPDERLTFVARGHRQRRGERLQRVSQRCRRRHHRLDDVHRVGPRLRDQLLLRSRCLRRRGQPLGQDHGHWSNRFVPGADADR